MTVGKLSLSSIANLISGLIRTKIYAILLGAYGIGLTSQIFNLSNLVCFVGTIGLPLGLINFFSKWEKANDWNRIYAVLNKMLYSLFLFGLLLSILVISFAGSVSNIILDDSNYELLIILTALSFPFSLSVAIFDAFFKGIKRFGDLVIISIINSLISIITAGILVYLKGLEGAVFALFLNSIFSFSLYLFVIYKRKLLIFKFRFNVSVFMRAD